MDNRDSGVFRLASVGNYLDALAAITEEMSLKERSNLIFLDRCLHELWGLGQNVILNWCPDGDGITLIVIPHYGVATYSSAPQVGPVRSAAEDVQSETGLLSNVAVGPTLPDPRAVGEGLAPSQRRADALDVTRAADEYAAA